MKYISILILFLSSTAFAGGWTDPAVPTRIDIVRNSGLMIYGTFGNASNCSVADKVFIPADHAQYNQIYAAALAAFSAGKKIQLYSRSCSPMGWYSIDSVTYNTMTDGALNIMN